MAKTLEEHAEFQNEIMNSVQHYRDLQNKERETTPTGSGSDFVIRHEGQEVLDFSSQYGSESSISYVACNLAGKPFVFPSYGDYTQTCVFRTYGPWWKEAPSGRRKYRGTPTDFCSEDFIEVSFPEFLFPIRIEVYETYNPGAIVRILACDRAGGTDVDRGSRWVTIWSGSPKPCKQRPRIFSPRLNKVHFATNLIRLELNHEFLEYYTELDGIKLIGTKTPPHKDQLEEQFESSPYQLVKEGELSNGAKDMTDNDSTRCNKNFDELLTDMGHLSLREVPEQACPSSDEGFLLTCLPKEIIQLILLYLNTRDLCRLAQTCSVMHDHCYDPLLYTDLNLQPYWPQISNSSLKSLSTRCERLQRLNLSWVGKGRPIYSDCLARLMHSSPDLQVLELSCCKFVDGSVLALIMTTCKNLQELNLSSCTRIEEFSTFNVLSETKLKRLNLYRTKIDAPSLISFIRSSPDLEYLNLASCTLLHTYINLVLLELGDWCKKLKGLDLWRMKSVTNIGLAHLHNCPLMEELDLGWCGDLKSYTQCIVRLAEKCVGLKKIFLTANRTVCDNDLKALANHCPNLEQVDILGTRGVTKEAVEFLLEKCKKLLFLDVSFCVGISTADVWHWRLTHPQVTIKKSFQHISVVD